MLCFGGSKGWLVHGHKLLLAISRVVWGKAATNQRDNMSINGWDSGKEDLWLWQTTSQNTNHHVLTEVLGAREHWLCIDPTGNQLAPIMCVHVCACVCMCVHVCACVCMCIFLSVSVSLSLSVSASVLLSFSHGLSRLFWSEATTTAHLNSANRGTAASGSLTDFADHARSATAAARCH